MFKNFATSIFARRACSASTIEAQGISRSELQDLFRSELEMHNLSAFQSIARNSDRRPQAFAA